LRLRVDRGNSDTEAAEVEWHCLADAVAHARILSTLTVYCEYNCNGCESSRCDFSPVEFEPDVAAEVTQLIASLHALTELHVDGDVEWVVDALRAAPSLRQLTLHYPSCRASHPGIREIMIECSAALTRTGCGEDVIATVCAGLEDTTSLTDLTLSLVDGSPASAVSAVHESVQRNSTLVRFVGYFNNDGLGI